MLNKIKQKKKKNTFHNLNKSKIYYKFYLEMYFLDIILYLILYFYRIKKA